MIKHKLVFTTQCRASLHRTKKGKPEAFLKTNSHFCVQDLQRCSFLELQADFIKLHLHRRNLAAHSAPGCLPLSMPRFRTVAWHGRSRASAYPEFSGMEMSQEMRQLLSGPISFLPATPDLPVSCPSPAGHIRSWWSADAEHNEDIGLHLVPDDFIKVISSLSRASSSISRLSFARTVYFN